MAAKRKKKSTDKKGLVLDAASVLRAFRERGKPLRDKEILRYLGAAKSRRQQLGHILDDLLEQGKIIRIKMAYGLAESMNLVGGRLEIQRSGVGFVIPDDKRRKDIFINPRDLGDAWHGDTVIAAVIRVRKTKSNEGRIVRILDRGVKLLPCRVVKRMGGFYLCRPTDPRQTMSFMADWDGEGAGPGPDDVVTVTPGDRLEHKLYSGTLVDLLGPQDDVAVQEKLVKLNHGVPTDFPKRVLAEAEALPKNPTEADFAGRRDLRDLPLATIDGAKARDFDDAVYVKKLSKGYRLWVAIADVSHYVAPGSALDKEALERCNSYYFPTSVEPMFPEALSNGLCSLNPDVPRLAMVAEILFTAGGRPKDAKFYPAVIQSCARLTYAQVNRAVIEKDEKERKNIEHVLPMLETAEALARKINAVRSGRGSLDFDLPEPEILFNLYGETVDIRPRVRNFAHQIIEEFMIAANEAVARFLSEHEAPFPYRIHPEPDPVKLEGLFNLLSKTELGAKLPAFQGDWGAGTLPSLLQAAAGTDLEYMVNRMTLRTMMQASYDPGNQGHFGLASTCYCHFTSPIRRYADLLVHRTLKLVLAGDAAKAMPRGRLVSICELLSKRERTAMEAEREILKRLTILFLADKVGQRFNGVVNSIADFGFWVEFREVMAEGMVRLSTMHDDYYGYFPERQELVGERTGRVLRMGRSVQVELVDVNLARLEVNLILVDEEASPEEDGTVRKRRGKRGRR